MQVGKSELMHRHIESEMCIFYRNLGFIVLLNETSKILDLHDLARHDVVAAWGPHDCPPSVVFPGSCGSVLKAQSTWLQVSSEQILPTCSRPFDWPSSSHLGVHNYFQLFFISHSFDMPKPLQPRSSQLQGNWRLTEFLSDFLVLDEIVPFHTRNAPHHSYLEHIQSPYPGTRQRSCSCTIEQHR